MSEQTGNGSKRVEVNSARKKRRRRGGKASGEPSFAEEVFDIPGTDPELLRSGRIPDPQPQHTLLFAWLAEVIGRIEEFLRARGGVPLRMSIRVFWGLLMFAGVFLLVGPVINKPLSFDDVIDGAEISEVDWLAQDAEIDYAVDRSDGGGFETTVSEMFNANFLNGPENRVVRTLVTEVNGHDAEFELLSATIDGEDAEVAVNRRATTTDVELRRADGAQLEGTQRVEIEYRLHHLVREEVDDATGEVVDQWSWPLFAPTWPQATKGIDVSITFSHEVDDALVRSPRATVAWLLLSGTEWLTPEAESSSGVTYSFSNDDTLPPNSDVWVLASFEPGTFELPPETTLFWVMTYGPLLPLVVLAVLVLFALAARWVVWADSAGEPWFSARSEPPDRLSPALAAQLLRKPRHAELVETLSSRPGSELGGARLLAKREGWVRKSAEAGRRAGRMGNLPSAWRWATRWRLSNALVQLKLRWVPDSYVRDTFIAAPIAVTLLQWGLLRQLSHQVILLVVWWPAVFVLVSTALAAVSLWAVLRPRPLTPQGALAVQQLKGIDVYARGTRLLDRGPLDEPLLPYAVLFQPPRSAGDRIAEHAVRESGDRELASGWRNAHFLSIPSMLGFVASAALFVGSIVLVSTQPHPYRGEELLTWPSSDFAGANWTQLTGFEIEAEIDRDEEGAARITAVERLQVQFDRGGGSVPQYTREWQTKRLGQDLGFELDSVRLDGAEIPFRTVSGAQTTAMTTQLSEVLTDTHEIEIRYALSSPAVEYRDGGDTVQQLRWSALIDSLWDEDYYVDGSDPFGDKQSVRPIRLRVTIAPELVEEMRSGGWIDRSDGERLLYESGSGERSWQYETDSYLDDVEFEYDFETDTYVDENGVEYDYDEGDSIPTTWYELRLGSRTTASDGSLVAEIDVDETESRTYERYGEDEEPVPPYAVDPAVNERLGLHALSLTYDLGVQLEFPDGTFANVERGAYDQHRIRSALPIVLLLGGTALIGALAAAVFVLARRLRERGPSASLLLSAGTLTLLAVAQSIVFWWEVGPMTDNGLAGLSVTISLVMWAAVVAQWIMVGIRVSKPRGAKSQNVKNERREPKRR